MSLFRLVLAFIVAAVVTAGCRPAWAGARERRAAYEEKLAEDLRRQHPDAVASFLEASRVSPTDPSRAIALYDDVSRVAPDFTPAIRRRAVLLGETGKRAEGIALARRAIAMNGSSENKMALALILSRTPGGAPATVDANEAMSLGRSATNERPDDVDAHLIFCQIALAAERLPDLQACAAKVVKLAPNEPEPHLFAALAAAASGDRGAAYKSVAEAQRLGSDPALVERITRALDESEPPLFRWGKRLLGVVGVWLLGLALLFAVGGALSKATLGLVRRLSPAMRREGAALRAVYRAVLHAASLYYYLSLPLVLLLSVLLGAGVILGFFYIGRIPIYLVVITGTIVLVTIHSVAKSLFIRSREVDPGAAVDLDKHPGLKRVIDEVAQRVGTRAVDEVYLTPNTDIAVLERGGLFRQLRGTTERCLVLGVGVLDGMKLRPFKAILAHEYGHFSNRDTAGGGVALSVRRSLLHTAVGLLQGGGATWYNPAWLFLVGFQKIFLRISQGASRLQEVMADHIAAFAYGPEAFAAGLTHVVRRSIEFDSHVDATLSEVVERSRPLANLYRYEPEKRAASVELEAAVKTALEAEPSPYDSHPRPVDRIAWVRELASSIQPTPDDDDEVWNLFASRPELEQHMTAEVRRRLADQGIVVAAQDAASPAPSSSG